jgi:hypothetical protein
MKNTIALAAFFITIVVLFVLYFVPKLDQYNSIDGFETSLYHAKELVPENAEVYFFSKDIVTDAPEVYYKVQFVLAPRIAIAQDFEKIPAGSYMVLVDDVSKTGAEMDCGKLLNGSESLYMAGSDYTVTLLRKK